MIPALPRDRLTDMYRRMLLIRRFEETVVENGHEIGDPYHVYIGQEATAIGACAALTPGDFVASTHRNHGHLLARGADPSRLMAEIYGKATGSNGGYGGTMHLIDAKLGFVATSGMVAGNIPVISGAGLACQVRQSRNIALGWFGEGALNEGAFYESMNMAALWRLPVVYVCENNTAAEPSAARASDGASLPPPFSREVTIGQIPATFNIPVTQVDGADVGLVYDAVARAVVRARDGDGPSFIEAKTHPWAGGSVDPDSLPGGRTDLSISTPLHDPVIRFTQDLLLAGVLDPAGVTAIDGEAQRAVEAAVDFARTSPLPDPEMALAGVFA